MAYIDVVVLIITIIEALRAFDVVYVVHKGRNGLEPISHQQHYRRASRIELIRTPLPLCGSDDQRIDFAQRSRSISSSEVGPNRASTRSSNMMHTSISSAVRSQRFSTLA